MANIERKHGLMSKPAVDYPERGEIVTSATYTLRVAAPEGMEAVEVSIDDGPWHPCRNAAGHWWYDWADYETGPHDAVARVRVPGGRIVSGALRNFIVNLAPVEAPTGE